MWQGSCCPSKVSGFIRALQFLTPCKIIEYQYLCLQECIYMFCEICYTPGIYAEGYIVFVFSFVCSFICSFVCSFVLPSRSWNYFKLLCSSNSSGVYLTNHSSESIHIWTIGTLEGRLSFHDSSSQGPCPRVGLEVKV